MPEYLAPGVFVEEVSFRAKSIEGVPTSTTGFAGMARFGPVYRPGGPANCEPRLVTSFTEYERIYGELGNLTHDGDERPCYMALATKAFFDNGGKRLYISRTAAWQTAAGAFRLLAATASDGCASRDVRLCVFDIRGGRVFRDMASTMARRCRKRGR